MNRKVRTLLFSTLYPSSVRPGHGIFVETRLRELQKLERSETRVVAPVPWFPSSSPRFGAWARFAATPHEEERNGFRVYHPRYLLPPKVGMNIAPLMLALGARATVARLIREGFDFDLIDAHYYYPDGVAAALLARWFGKPFVVTARGTDLSLIPDYPLPRRMILWTAARAEASIGVCEALMQRLGSLGAEGSRLRVMRNGVDLERFKPLPRSECRRELDLPEEGLLLLSIGHLVELKGHHLAIDALAELPGVRLAIVGGGEMRAELESRAAGLGVADRVTFAGARPNTELRRWFGAADALVLASSREGWANVLLESMACGTPVVATRVGGTPEVVASSEVGELIDEHSGPGIAAGVRALFGRNPSREAIRRYAEGFGWEPTSRAQVELFTQIAANSATAAR
ncbi:MAG: glycosyltransferase family 4 protein [Betaproteobacteria bacterium]|nr:glycosyltransferase family 4 protein [Betaproteobacteria bacterium]